MPDPDPGREDEAGSGGAAEAAEAPADDPAGSGAAGGSDEDRTEAQLRERVMEKYDFEDFGPADMQEMTAEEWEVAFDSASWITGDELLDRVRSDLEGLIAERQVFAVLEDVHEEGQRRLLAYSDEGYALVYPDGGVAGFGTVLRDVKPVVALCSMDSYEPREAPADPALLPDPEEVPEASGEFGNLMVQVVAAVQLLAALVLFGAWLLYGLSVLVPAAGLFFMLVGLFLFLAVANARLSDRFRAEEYRERLRAVGLEDGERPEFLPVEDGEVLPPGERPVDDAGRADGDGDRPAGDGAVEAPDGSASGEDADAPGDADAATGG